MAPLGRKLATYEDLLAVCAGSMFAYGVAPSGDSAESQPIANLAWGGTLWRQ